jgi:hypothetical protein
MASMRIGKCQQTDQIVVTHVLPNSPFELEVIDQREGIYDGERVWSSILADSYE